MKSLADLFFTSPEKSADSKRVVGIDMGSSSIKVVEVQERKGILTLTTYGELQLGPYAEKEIGQSVDLEVKKEQQALLDIIREAAVKAEEAVFAMPLTSSFVTTINFQASASDDISSRVRVEARKYIPVPINEVALDWAEIELDQVGDKTERHILVAAIQNEALNRFKILMQFAKLGDPPTEIECFSALRGVYQAEEENVAVIDIGAVSTKLYIARKGLLQRMHRVRSGGAVVTKRLSSTLEVSFEEAEIIKRNITKQDKNFHDAKKANHSCYDRAMVEFRQLIKEHERNLDTKMTKVYLAGGGSLFPTTKSLIEESLQMPVEYVNPFNKVAYPAFMEDTIADIAPSFHTALGAALRKFEQTS